MLTTCHDSQEEAAIATTGSTGGRPPRFGARLGGAILGGLGVVLGGALLAWSYERAGGARFVDALAPISLAMLIPALLCEGIVQLSKAIKWIAILTPIKRVRLRSALQAVLVGGMATHVVPLRVDELLRAKLLGDAEQIPTATVLGTVGVDRIIEVLVLGSLLGLLAVMGDLSGPLTWAVRVVWAAFAGLTLGLVVALRAEDRVRSGLRAWGGRGRRLSAAIEVRLGEFLAGLRALPRGRALGLVVAATAAEWGATIAMYAVVLRALQLEVRPDVPLLLALGGAAAYGVPNVPGAIGTFEAAQLTLLDHATTLPPGTALAVAIVAHAVLTLPITIVGSVVGLSIWLRRRAHLTP